MLPPDPETVLLLSVAAKNRAAESGMHPNNTRRISEREQLLEVSAAQSRRIVQFASGSIVEQFAYAHQPARKCPSPATGPPWLSWRR